MDGAQNLWRQPGAAIAGVMFIIGTGELHSGRRFRSVLALRVPLPGPRSVILARV